MMDEVTTASTCGSIISYTDDTLVWRLDESGGAPYPLTVIIIGDAPPAADRRTESREDRAWKDFTDSITDSIARSIVRSIVEATAKLRQELEATRHDDARERQAVLEAQQTLEQELDRLPCFDVGLSSHIHHAVEGPRLKRLKTKVARDPPCRMPQAD